ILGKGKGFYGKIELGYTYDRWLYKNGLDLDIKRSIFSQSYQIGYDGFIYHPRLLSFDIKTDFRLDRSKYEGNSSSTTNRFRGLGYTLRLNFLRGTRYPFNISLGRKYTVSRLVGGYREQEIDTTINFFRINTSYLLKKNWYITAYFDRNTVDSTYDFLDYTNKSTSFGINTSYTRDDKRFSFSASQTDISNNSPYYNYDDTIRRINLSAHLIRDTWNLGARTSYYSSSLANLDTFTQTVSYGYRPSRKFNLGLSSFVSFTRGNTNTNYYSVRENLNYRLNDNWSLFQSAGFYSLEDTISINFSGGAGYHKTFSETLSAGFSFSSSINRFFGGEDKTYYGLNLNGHLSKLIPSWKATFTTGVGINQLFLDGSQATTNARFTETLNISLTRSLSFFHTFSYSHNVSQENDYDYRIFRTSNSLTYKFRVFRSLFINSQVGVDYWKMVNTDAKSLKPFVKARGMWPVTRRLNITFEAEAYRDSYYNNTLTLRASMKANYRIRKTLVTFDFKYTKEVFENETNYTRNRLVAGIRLTRYF
ncbi:MAG: hypothetical protein GXO39_07095, partial [Thermotogae bacterium]|nr:hypothetical protein [Thermotogota bacterium]